MNSLIFYMFENPRRGRQARNFTTNVPKILVLKSSSNRYFPKINVGCPCLVICVCIFVFRMTGCCMLRSSLVPRPLFSFVSGPETVVGDCHGILAKGTMARRERKGTPFFPSPHACIFHALPSGTKRDDLRIRHDCQQTWHIVSE